MCLASIDPDTRPPVDAYRCNCVAGFANGVCDEGWNVDGDDVVLQALVDLYEQAALKILVGIVTSTSTSVSPAHVTTGLAAPSHKVPLIRMSRLDQTLSRVHVRGYANGVCAYDWIVQLLPSAVLRSEGPAILTSTSVLVIHVKTKLSVLIQRRSIHQCFRLQVCHLEIQLRAVSRFCRMGFTPEVEDSM